MPVIDGDNNGISWVAELDQANKVIALASAAMNYMGDKCNAADDRD